MLLILANDQQHYVTADHNKQIQIIQPITIVCALSNLTTLIQQKLNELMVYIIIIITFFYIVTSIWL